MPFREASGPITARSSLHDERTITHPGADPGAPQSAMSVQELLSALVSELPAPAPVEPFAFLDDELVPRGLTPVEPSAFALACAQALWGATGPRN